MGARSRLACLDPRSSERCGMAWWAALLVIAIAFWAGPGQAQEVKALGAFGDWRAFALDGKDGKTCYMISQPKKDEGNYSKRGKIYAMVTHRQSDKVRDEVSFWAGYRYKDSSQVDVAIDGRSFVLYPHEEIAWTPDSASDRSLVAAMKAGRGMVVTGTSSRGTVTKDTYSLIGFSKAHQSIDGACPD